MTESSRAWWKKFLGQSVFRWCPLLLAVACLGGNAAHAAVDLVVRGTDAPDPVVTLSNLTYTITVTNVGPTAASAVGITNVLSTQVNFVSVTFTRGSCSNVSGVVYCDWGTLNPGAGGRVTITARPTQPGPVTNVVSAAAEEADANSGDNSLTQTTTAVNRRTFTNTDFIQIDEVLANPAVPYPSTITVSGLTAAVHKVTVTLNNVSHGDPDDLQVLLVAPNGTHVMLFSDGPTSPPMVDVILTFDDAAAQPVPDFGAIANGSYKPANYGSVPDILPAPAPPGPHFPGFPELSAFNHGDPNGEWRLFVYDEEPEAGGWIDGWSMTIFTLEHMANLTVSSTDSPDPALPGGIITYTTHMTNLGPVRATDVRVTNQVPAGMELVSYSVSQGSCTNGGGIVSCDVGELAVGDNAQLVIQARPATGGTYSNRVQVASNQLDPQPASNVAVQSTLVEPRINMRMDMTSSRTPALLEQPLIYTLIVTNLGPDPATGVRVVDQLPPNLLLVNAIPSQGGSCSNSAGIVTCPLGTIASGARATVMLTCRPIILGPITNVAFVTSDQVDTDPANNSAQNLNTVDPAADLQLTMTDAPDPVALTQPLAYTILLTNRGPSVGSNIVISDVLPPSLSFISAQTTHGACTNDGNSVACLIGELPVGQRVIVTISATANSVGTTANSAMVISQPVDPVVANNAVSVATLVGPSIDLSVTKTSDRPAVWEGDRLTYSFVVSNRGPSTANNARLSDALPPGMIVNSATTSVGFCSLQAGLVTCSFGQIAPGNSVTISIVGTVPAADMITNVVNVFANEQDLNFANNTAGTVSVVIPRTATHRDTNTVVLPELGSPAAYPLTINISGMTAAVQRVRVTLPNFSHSFPDDLDVLLVGPGGQAVVVMSDAGGSSPVTNIDLTVDDLAGSVLPDSSSLSGAVYGPADYEPGANEFPAPAPPGPYAPSFNVFTGTDPNGAWKLYIIDDALKDSGVLGSGWRLDIWARDPLADLTLATQGPPDAVAVGSNIIITVAVSNQGPGVATAVVVTNAPNSDALFVGATASQGSCTNEAGRVRCNLGELPPGGSAVVQMFLTPLVSGTVSNFVGASASSIDLNPSNNAMGFTWSAMYPPVITSQPRSRFVPAGTTVIFEVVATGEPPLSYQWYREGIAIADATNPTLTITDVQPEVFGEYRVQIANRVGAVLSDPAHLGFPLPPVLEAIPDQITGEDEPLIVPLVISDPNPFEPFQVSAVCDDTNLVPATNITFAVIGTNSALVIVPGTNQFGTNVIRVTLTDSAGLTASQTFVLSVEAINDYPRFVVPVLDQTVQEGQTVEFPFVIGDAETRAESLILGARIYELDLARTTGIALSGTDSNRVLLMAFTGNTFGSSLVEIRVRDEAGVRSTNFFTITVLPVEDAPIISAIDDVTILEDGELTVNFTASDAETAPGNLLLRAESSNPALFANDAFSFESTDGLHTLSARPIANQSGFSRITVFVEDEAGVISSNSFWVTVDPVNDVPFVSEIPDVVTTINETSSSVAFTVNDFESDPDSLVFTAISTNTLLASPAGIAISGSGSNRFIQVTPGEGQFGWTVLRLEVADSDGGVAIRQFQLTVHQTSGPPAIIQQPQGQSVTPGSPVTLRVIATGPGALRYQWQKNGQNLTDQTNAVFVIVAAVGADRGEYGVTIANAEGNVTSEPAQVMVFETTRIVNLRHAGTTVELSFGTVVGQRYFVEFQDFLGVGWSTLPGVAGTGDVVTVIDLDPVGNSRFYRVRVE